MLSTNAALRAALWHIRKGLYATIAGARPSGTTALLEDIAVPVARLSDTCAGLQRLFEVHGYGDAVIFGHAKDGNIHFLITEDFDDPASVVRYRAFTDDMVDLVLAAGGTLKAEHGTGKIMAPFVARQYGPELYAIMREIKRAFDPSGHPEPRHRCSPTTPTCTCATSSPRRRSRPRSTAASSAATASRSARARTSPPLPASGSWCAARSPRRTRAATRTGRRS